MTRSTRRPTPAARRDAIAAALSHLRADAPCRAYAGRDVALGDRVPGEHYSATRTVTVDGQPVGHVFDTGAGGRHRVRAIDTTGALIGTALTDTDAAALLIPARP